MQTTLSASSRTYSVLLILYPLELRREFAQEMTDVFEQQLQGAWEENGLKGMCRVWLCAIGELLCVALPAQLAQPVLSSPRSH